MCSLLRSPFPYRRTFFNTWSPRDEFRPFEQMKSFRTLFGSPQPAIYKRAKRVWRPKTFIVASYQAHTLFSRARKSECKPENAGYFLRSLRVIRWLWQQRLFFSFQRRTQLQLHVLETLLLLECIMNAIKLGWALNCLDNFIKENASPWRKLFLAKSQLFVICPSVPFQTHF